jgi:hypothetical protein
MRCSSCRQSLLRVVRAGWGTGGALEKRRKPEDRQGQVYLLGTRRCVGELVEARIHPFQRAEASGRERRCRPDRGGRTADTEGGGGRPSHPGGHAAVLAAPRRRAGRLPPRPSCRLPAPRRRPLGRRTARPSHPVNRSIPVRTPSGEPASRRLPDPPFPVRQVHSGLLPTAGAWVSKPRSVDEWAACGSRAQRSSGAARAPLIGATRTLLAMLLRPHATAATGVISA